MNTSAPRAAAWILEYPTSNAPAESTRIPDDGSTVHMESIIGDDKREPIDIQDLRDGHKYRSIVKIQSCFKDKSGKSVWMMGTGWLISNNLVVTAGHVVYDWSKMLGAATQIKCYIGYQGRNSVPTSDADQSKDCQARYGKMVVTTVEWIQRVDSRSRDVAFIQVGKRFTGDLRLFPYGTTPNSETSLVGVVGYAGDKDHVPGMKEEYGGFMYEQFIETTYNLETDSRHMIEYGVSTFGGQSGAPILCREKGKLRAIGTHCYGGGGSSGNYGNAIGGFYGNDYEAFKALFNNVSAFGTPTKISILDTEKSVPFPNISGPISREDQSVFSSTSKPISREDQRVFPSTSRSIFRQNQAEGFMDVLKSIAQVGRVALPIASPLLGPVGIMIGSAAGAILGAISESAIDGPVSFSSTTELAPGAAERALLAEASLQAVLLMDENSPELAQIMEQMKKNWILNAPNVDAIAPLVLPHLTESALDIAANKLSLITSGEIPTESVIERQRKPLIVGAVPESMATSYFAEGLMDPAFPLAGQPEGFFSWLGLALNRGISLGKPFVTDFAKDAVTSLIPKLMDKATKYLGGAESISSAPTPNEEAARIILNRAIIADTALQALMSLPREQLQNMAVAPLEDGMPEGIFDFIKTAVQKIGPVALDAAKKAMKNIAPALINAANQTIMANEGGLTTPVRTITRKRSFLEGLQSRSAAVQVSAPILSLALEESAPVAATTRYHVDKLEKSTPLVETARDLKLLPQPRRSSVDSNDDLPVIMNDAPPYF